MNTQNFIARGIASLQIVLDAYLQGEKSHDDVQKEVDALFSAWDSSHGSHASPYVAGEREFWCALWASQHLATEDHWKDGVTQRELGFMHKVLQGVESLPSSYQGRRP